MKYENKKLTDWSELIKFYLENYRSRGVYSKNFISINVQMDAMTLMCRYTSTRNLPGILFDKQDY